jgi:hypothetical protein
LYFDQGPNLDKRSSIKLSCGITSREFLGLNFVTRFAIRIW